MLGLSMEAALLRSLTVLVISCPCTLGIAVPLARIAGVSLAGKKGIIVRFFFFRKGNYFGCLVLMIRTITRGQWKLLKIIPEFNQCRNACPRSVARQTSEHCCLGNQNRMKAGLELVEPVDVKFRTTASLAMNNQEVKIGSSDLLRGDRPLSSSRRQSRNEDHLGLSQVYMSVNKS
jgi:Cu2+-exporting ATPase/Cu+-exporting ATPase